MVFIDGTVVNVALPALQSALNATLAEVQWVVESYALLLAVLLLTGGSLGDLCGRRRMFTIGVMLFASASVWCGHARPPLTCAPTPPGASVRPCRCGGSGRSIQRACTHTVRQLRDLKGKRRRKDSREPMRDAVGVHDGVILIRPGFMGGLALPGSLVFLNCPRLHGRLLGGKSKARNTTRSNIPCAGLRGSKGGGTRGDSWVPQTGTRSTGRPG